MTKVIKIVKKSMSPSEVADFVEKEAAAEKAIRIDSAYEFINMNIVNAVRNNLSSIGVMRQHHNLAALLPNEFSVLIEAYRKDGWDIRTERKGSNDYLVFNVAKKEEKK